MSDDSQVSGQPSQELATTGSKVVYENRWMKVREDETLRPDGTKGIYGVVEKADFALIVPYSSGGFHLVEQYRYPVKGRYWEFPQGSWEATPNVDALELARGELREETGLTALTMLRLGHLFEAYGYSNQGFDVFLATDLTEGESDPDPEEAGIVSRWFSEEELWGLVSEGRFKDAPSLAALALFQRRVRLTGDD